MNKQVTNLAGRASRRSFLTAIGAGAACAGVTLLAGCNDDVVGAEAVPTPTPTATPTPPVAYEATDSDRSNFTLQLHYLLAAFLQTALTGSGLPTNLTSGTGTPGQVSGGRAVPFTTPALVASVREISTATTARIALLRRTLGSAATAQPAISIAGGQDGPFQKIAQLSTSTATTTATTPATFFDPYASEADFLLGAVALFAVATSSAAQLAPLYATGLRGTMGALAAGVAASNAVTRNALFVAASQEAATTSTATATSLFARAAAMSRGRDQFDGPGDRDQSIGSGSAKSVSANITIVDGNAVAVRRTPEQALGILYANAAVASSGAFFPAGVNGTIRFSGLNS